MPQNTITFTVFCRGCPTQIKISICPDLSDERFTAEMVRQATLAGWIVVGDVPLCPICAENRIDAVVGGESR